MENQWLLFRHLKQGRFEHVLGFGSAYAEELLPLVTRIGHATIVEPSDAFIHADLEGVPLRYVKPRSDGRLECPDASVDLLTCFSVLHHIPNVSTTLAEFARCLRPGAVALITEPTVSMGDWRTDRGLTPHERGIPLGLFRQMIAAAGLRIQVEKRYQCQLSSAFTRLTGISWNQSRLGLRIDHWLSRLVAFNGVYHACAPWQKVRPASVAYLLEKPAPYFQQELR